jgi:4-hydroxy-tetrahydrodipicolinate synthase
MFTGALTALVTPFKDGKIDEEALRRLVEFQIKNGTNGLVPCGTTGESATLSHGEHNRVIDITIEKAKGRVPVVAGTGSNSTAETVTLTKHAQEAGADAALLISPYYNKPSQDGLYEHYRIVAGEVDLPLIVYNVPGRTALNMLPETVARLSEIKNIIGIKEATADLEQVSEVIEYSREGFCVLSGDDSTTFPLLAVGGHGVISVTSNIAPGDVADMCRLFLSGKVEEARRLHYKLQPLNRAMFVETNPVPVKTALSMMGMVTGELRLPLVGLSEGNRRKVQQALKSYGLI